MLKFALESQKRTISLPSCGLGTYKITVDQMKNCLDVALSCGYRLFDTASGYKNEEAIGNSLKELLVKYNISREEIFITTKLAPKEQGKAKEALETSLQKLSMDYVDLYLIHWPGAHGKKPNDSIHKEMRRKSWLQMEELVKEGKARMIGVSNYTVNHLKELLEFCEIKPTVLQNELHPFLQQKVLKEFCKEHCIHYQAYSSLGSMANRDEILANKTILKLAKLYDKTPANIALRWALEGGSSVIPKSVDPDHIKSNIDLYDFALTGKDLTEISKLDRDQHFCWNPVDIA